MNCINLLTAFCLLGVVDQVYGSNVHVEMTTADGTLKAADLPLWLFPCKITEGDIFYFTKTNGVLELRCGEPPVE